MNRYLGLIVFIVVKLSIIWIHPTFSEMPRLGDDSLVYIWGGEVLAHQNEFQKSSVAKSLVSYGEKANLSFTDHRFLGRSLVHWYPVYDIINSFFTVSHLEIKYAIQETFVLLILALSILYFFKTFLSNIEAQVALVVLAFPLFPSQGLHYFIPSLLALSYLLFLVGSVWHGQNLGKSKWLFVHILGLGTHVVAAGYGLIAIGIFCLKIRSVKKVSLATLYFLIAWIFWSLFHRWFLYEPYSGVGLKGYISLWPIPFQNISAAGDHLLACLYALPLLIVSPIAIWKYRAVSDSRDKLLSFYALLVVALGSLAYVVPNYPGEVFSRISLSLLIFLVGLSVKFLLSKDFLRFRSILFILLTVQISAQVIQLRNYVWSNLTSRLPPIQWESLSDAWADIGSQPHITFLDMDIAFMATLLAKKWDFSLNVFKEGQPKIPNDSVYVALFPQALIERAQMTAGSWGKVIMGFSGGNGKTTKVISGSPTKTLFIKRGSERKNIVVNGCRFDSRYSGLSGWKKYDCLQESRQWMVEIEKGGALLGVQFKSPVVKSLNWAWGEGLVIEHGPRDNPHSYDFNVDSISSKVMLSNSRQASLKVLSDSSGLIFFSFKK